MTNVKLKTLTLALTQLFPKPLVKQNLPLPEGEGRLRLTNGLMIARVRALVLFVFWNLLFGAYAQASVFDWQVHDSEEFTIFYPKGYEQKAGETLYYLKKYQPTIKKLTGNSQKFNTRIILQDPGLMANGYADALNYKIGVYSNTLAGDYDQSWLRKVAVHESIHINQLTNTSGQARLATELFGNSFSPNVNIPMWLLEGITVYGESQISPYEGRMSSGYFDAILATKAKAGRLPNPLQANYISANYPFGSYYLYGGGFVRFLAEKYGEERLAQFFKLYGYYYWIPYVGSLYPAYGLDEVVWQIYGKSFYQLFDEWQAYEEKKAAGFKISGTKIAGQELSTVKNLTAYQGKLYYYQRDYLLGGPFAYNSYGSIIEYDPASGRKKVLTVNLADQAGSIQKLGNKIYYALIDVVPWYPNVDENSAGYVAFVYELDEATGQKRVLFNDELNDFAVMPDGRIIYVKERKAAFGSEIWQFADGKKTKLGEVGQLIGEIEYAGEPRHFVVSSKYQLSSWNINTFDLGTLSFEPLVNSPWHEVKIKINGDKLYFTANHDKRLSVYEYNLASGKTSNVTDSSYASDGLMIGDDLFFVGVESGGEWLYRSSEPEAKRLGSLTKLGTDTFSVGTFEVITGEPALAKNFSYFLMPSSRFFPALAMGQDGLGYNQYGLFYSTDGGLDFKFHSKLFFPLFVGYSNVYTVDQRKNYLTLTLPLYYSLRSGLSAVFLTAKTDFSTTIPGLIVDYSQPCYKLATLSQTDVVDGGFSFDAGNRFLYGQGSVNLNIAGYRDFERIRSVRGLVRSTYNNTSGYEADLLLQHRLLPIQNGLWNPNVFVGDVYGGPFVQYSNTNTNVTAYGLELGAEVGLGFWINFVPRGGISIIDGQKNYYFNLNISLY